MLADSKIVGFIFTRDYDNARAFYEGKLGFQFVSQDQFALAVRAGAHMIRITKIPDFTPARATVLGWEVADIESMVAWLRGRGVILEDYPFIQDRKLGIWTAPGGARIAWFKDPDGNVLSVSQHT
jgi:catechol 2,3-dioxygenase-like lactoylglutathione lyase family enzyme